MGDDHNERTILGNHCRFAGSRVAALRGRTPHGPGESCTVHGWLPVEPSPSRGQQHQLDTQSRNPTVARQVDARGSRAVPSRACIRENLVLQGWRNCALRARAPWCVSTPHIHSQPAKARLRDFHEHQLRGAAHQLGNAPGTGVWSSETTKLATLPPKHGHFQPSEKGGICDAFNIYWTDWQGSESSVCPGWQCGACTHA